MTFSIPRFRLYYQRLGTPQTTFKRDDHGLANAIPIEQIDAEVQRMLDAISDVAASARPAESGQ